MRKDKLISLDTKQILLLGTENSGKSTIMKQIKRIFGDGYTEREKMKFKGIIHKFIIGQMIILLSHLDTMQLRYINLSENGWKAKKFMDNIQIINMLTERIYNAIKCLWNEKCIKDIFKQIVDNTNIINIQVEYFWNDIDRIYDGKYIPSDYDILRVPHKPAR